MTGTTDLDPQVELEFEPYRRELTAYCYRMLGSPFEAEDAVQETLVRAWRGFGNFEGRSALRSWLYRIASNVCFDMLKGRKRRAMPIDVTELGSVEGHIDPPTSEADWMGPINDARVLPEHGDPAEIAEARESVRLAFVAALQYLPARQRAVLILREVLRWRASEVAELLDTTEVSVNSALQRARATLAERNVAASSVAMPADDAQKELLARYVDAFERFDIEAIVALLHDDVVMSMPPWPLWLRGPDEWRKFLLGPGHECEGSKLVYIDVNGTRGLAQYRRTPGGGYHAWAIHVLELSDGKITGIDMFVDADYFQLFDLPRTFPA
jgi:RNA polymerase sigma-70 factor (ECF subfamily)